MKKIILGIVFVLGSLSMSASNSSIEFLNNKVNFEITDVNNNVDFTEVIDLAIIKLNGEESVDTSLPWCTRLALATAGLMEDLGFSGEAQLAVANEIGSWC